MITSVDQETVKGGAELQQILLKKEAGDVVSLGMLRDTQQLRIDVELVKRETLFKVR
jgi:S1-C subfamily serine protease